ncbi:MAG: hypothetical protein D3920_06715, partial [Candidatus Electrothrix sp. AW2]|nr:hypothetical protein [Candidatus Electrothrix gigas]
NYLRLAEIGRTEMLRTWGIPYREMEQQGKKGLRTAVAFKDFRRQARNGVGGQVEPEQCLVAMFEEVGHGVCSQEKSFCSENLFSWRAVIIEFIIDAI